MFPPMEDLNSGLVRNILKIYNSDDSVRGKIAWSEGLIIIIIIIWLVSGLPLHRLGT